MFSHPFYPVRSTFQERLEVASTPSRQATRFPAFGRFAHDVLGWFHSNPGLESVKLVSVTTVNVEGNAPPSVTIRSHPKIVTEGAPGLVPDVLKYADEALPWQRIGTGAFVITRQDPLVAKFLQLSPYDVGQYDALVQELSLKLDNAFFEAIVSYDIGVAPI